MKTSYERLRQILVEELKDKDCMPVKLPFDKELLNKLLFDGHEAYKKFDDTIKEVLTKIDYSNVSFDVFDAENFDFSNYTGIKINPQTIFCKNLNGAICSGVEFIGPFDDVKVFKTNFTGSIGAKINPQTISCRNLSGAICNGVEFIGSFDGVKTSGTDFTGSNYEAPLKEEDEFRQKVKQIFLQNNLPR